MTEQENNMGKPFVFIINYTETNETEKKKNIY